MDKVEIQWLKSQGGSIAQIYSSGLEFCFVSDDMRQCHTFVFCKDFLQDAIQGYLHNKKATIYGFSYDPTSSPGLCTKRTRIALANRNDDNFGGKMDGMVDFVNQFAKKLKLKRTHVFEAIDVPSKYSKCGIFLTDGSPRWMNSPPLISMYSLLLRVGCAHTKGHDYMETIKGLLDGKVKQYQTNDVVQLQNAMSGIEKILDVGYRKFFYIDSEKNYPENAATSTMHNSCGIGGFSSGYSRGVCKYWHRKSLQETLKVKKRPGKNIGK